MRCHATLASVALLVLVAGSAEADRKAEKLLQRAEAVTRKTRSLQATLRDVANGTTGTLRLAKPRSIYLALPGKDGDQSVVVNRGEDLLMIDEASSSGSVSEFEFLFEFGTVSAPITLAGCFFDPLIYRSFVQPSYAGTVARYSATYEVVKCPPSFGRGAITLYFGPSGLPEGIEIAALQTAEMIAAAQNIWLEDLRLNVRLPASAFTYASSRNVKVNPEKNGLTKFLPENAQAPRFVLPTVDGESRSLNDLLKNKKAVLLNFTFAGCGACIREIPPLNQLYSEFKDRGLDIIAINMRDDSATAKRFIEDYQLMFPHLLDGKDEVSTSYQVDVGGVNYLIDNKGKIIWRDFGLNEVRLRSMLENLGIRAFPRVP